jgi:Ergosterol biosynthesis ERG4/ERG24 family
MLTRQADDDKVCRAKYGPLWDRYTAKVRWRIVPRVN